MDRTQFWKLMNNVDRVALRRFDETAAVQPLIVALGTQDEQVIAGFEEQLAQVLYELDGETYAANAGASGGSSDGFLYARCFVVASGEQHYSKVLANPAAMPKSIDEWCEALLYVARSAWAEKTGRDQDECDFETSVSYETGSNASKWN